MEGEILGARGPDADVFEKQLGHPHVCTQDGFLRKAAATTRFVALLVSTTAPAFGCQVRVFCEVSFPRLELVACRFLSFKFRITFFPTP